MPTIKKPAKTEGAAEKKPAARKKAVPKEQTALLSDDKAVVTEVAAPTIGEGQYIFAVGRRKSAIASTKLWLNGKGEITVNGKDYETYFPVYQQREAVLAPLKAVGYDGKVTIAIRATGGGLRGQAEAVRLGISRALIALNPTYRGSLKKLGFLTRDAREKERKKFGFKKARRGPQWAKR